MKKCFKCGQAKRLSNFYVHKRMADGHLNKCIECNKKDALEHRLKNIEKIRQYDRDRATLPHRKKQARRIQLKYRKEHPDRVRQNNRLGQAVKTGKIMKPDNCEVCGMKNSINGHHQDYSNPLDVIWVCQSCHKQLHKTQVIKDITDNANIDLATLCNDPIVRKRYFGKIEKAIKGRNK